MIVLDTNVVSELVRRRTSEQVRLWADRQPPDSFALTALSVFELRFGLELMAPSRHRSELQELVHEFVASLGSRRILVLDSQSAERAAAFRAERRKSGRPVAVPDSPIAGIALRHGAALATRNLRDFGDSGLSLLDPWQGASA